VIAPEILNAIIREAIEFPRLPYGKAYELHKRVHLIDLPVNVKGFVNGKKNRFTRPFFTGLVNWFSTKELRAINTDGNERPVFLAQYVSADVARISIGQDTDDILFSDYHLVGASYIASDLVSYQELADRIRVVAEAIATVNGTSVGLCMRPVYQAPNYYTTFLIAGRLQSVATDQVIDYYLDFYEPWTLNFALAWYGVLGYTTAVLKDTTGATATINFQTNYSYRGIARLTVGTSNTPFSFGDYGLTNPVEISNTWIGESSQSYVFGIVHGAYVPATDVNIYEVGLVQKLRDTGGVDHDFLMCRIVLPSPITLVAGKNNLLLLRILGM